MNSTRAYAGALASMRPIPSAPLILDGGMDPSQRLASRRTALALTAVAPQPLTGLRPPRLVAEYANLGARGPIAGSRPRRNRTAALQPVREWEVTRSRARETVSGFDVPAAIDRNGRIRAQWSSSFR